MQSKYLTTDEINEYCGTIPVIESQVLFASAIIDAYIGGNNFTQKQVTEKNLKSNKKGIIKLKYSPIISIGKVELCVPNGFAYTATVSVPIDYINFDESGYVFMPMNGDMAVTAYNLYGVSPRSCNITYTYGYQDVPDQVKLACAMISMNIAQQGGFANIQSVTTLDARYALTDPSVFTNDIRAILAEFRR